MTLDEAWEGLQPSCNIFEAAEWLNAQIRTGKVRLLLNGHVIAPDFFVTHLVIVGMHSPHGHPSLALSMLRAVELGAGIWTLDRESFQAAQAETATKRGGRPRTYNREALLGEAWVYTAIHGVPDTLTGEGGLLEKLELELGQNRCPARTQLQTILGPYFERIADKRKASKSR
jgi:hypothetical protein